MRARDHLGERRHVAVVGFMGAGKTTVGKLLAERLSAAFVDLDDAIARKAGRSIPEIFREHGEVGFRAHERATLREVLESEAPLVIATGGGTFADASMRRWIQDAARTVYLKASPEVLFARIGSGAGRMARPLLSGPDPLGTIRRLLAERAPTYEECDIAVTTDRASCEELVAEVVTALKERGRTQARREPRSDEPRARGLEPRAARREPRAEGDGVRREARAEVPPPRREPRLEVNGARRGRAAEPAGRTESGSGLDDDARATVTGDGAVLLRVHSAQGSYPVEMRPEAGGWLGEGIAAVCASERVAVVSDTTVAGIHAEALLAALEAQGKRVSLHTFSPGEESKTLATAGVLYDELLGAGLGRSDLVVALGGGVVGDVAGFVASTFLRGVPFVQVPTTTLAAVDASVGGKNGVNTARGKNLVGTIHAPRAVLVAGAHLATQPARQHAAGIVEAVKVAAALDARAFDALLRDTTALLAFEPSALARTVARAVALKASVVGRDERESGERAVLNYGHTVGHAIETGEGYRLLHGEAVALGMLAEASWAESEGLAEGVVAPIAAALAGLGVPTRWRDARIDFAALAVDKKRQGALVRLPVVKRIGAHELRSVQLERLLGFLQSRSG